MSGWGRVIIDQRRSVGGRLARRMTTELKCIRQPAPTQNASDTGRDNDEREGQVPYRDADEGQQGDGDQPAIFKSAAANTPCCGEHDGNNSRLDAIQHTRDDGDITKSEIDPGQQDKYQ